MLFHFPPHNPSHLNNQPRSASVRNLTVAAGDVVDGNLAFRVRILPRPALRTSMASDLIVRGLQLLAGDRTPIPLDKDPATVSESIRAARAGIALAVLEVSDRVFLTMESRGMVFYASRTYPLPVS